MLPMPDAERAWFGKGVVKGLATGPAQPSATPISFLGDIDIRSGRVVGKSSDLLGESLAGKVLIVPATRGSAGAWRFLYQLKAHGTHPAALVTVEMPDPSVVQGAILANIPVVASVPNQICNEIGAGETLAVDGTAGKVWRLLSP